MDSISMEAAGSVYHRFQALFLRSADGQLLHITGPHRDTIRYHWSSILKELRLRIDDSTGDPCVVQLGVGRGALVVYETQRCGEKAFTGLVLACEPATRPESDVFDTFFARVLLDQTSLAVRDMPNTSPQTSTEIAHVTNDIVRIFDSHLRYHSPGDQWAAKGRHLFRDRVHHFTSQNIPVEFCLPAFPCKSSNLAKVAGNDPDRGEELALHRMHDFVEAIESVYKPGAKLWIISDGHVFSDCIGRDDADVDEFGEKLRQMNEAIASTRGNTGCVDFKSLVDIFELRNLLAEDLLVTLADDLRVPHIHHYLKTDVTDEAEACRRILMAGCQIPSLAVRQRIQAQEPAMLSLYRGFSRFMLDDLELHPATRGLSRSQRKKIARKVSFEMILRNQAYSNLVEMVFPNHIRLSIHAHDNFGPKFAIQLFDPTKVKATYRLDEDSETMISDEHLHIPTPWHNCVVELTGSKLLFVTKSRIAREYMAAGELEGHFVPSHCGRGGYFSLHRPRKGEQIMEPPGEKLESSTGVLLETVATANSEHSSRDGITAWLVPWFEGLIIFLRRAIGLPLYNSGEQCRNWLLSGTGSGSSSE